MFFVLNFFVENNALVTKANCKELRDYVTNYYPNAKVSWQIQPGVFENSDLSDTVDYIGECVAVGDDAGMGTGFPCIDWTDAEAEGYATDVYNYITSNYGITPITACAYGWRSSQLQLLHDNLGTKIVMGTAWSQEKVDRYSGSGSIPMPYYTSKTHNLIPAQSTSDKVGTITMDTNSPDFVGNKHVGCRFTVHPADPTGYDGNHALHVTNQYINNNRNPFILLNSYIEVLWLNETTSLKDNWKDYIDKLYLAYPTMKFVTMRYLNTWFRKNYSDTPDYEFEFTGSGYEQSDHTSTTRTAYDYITAYWLFTTNERVGVWYNSNTETYSIVDCLRYTTSVTEPTGKCDRFTIKSGLNWKLDDSNKGFEHANLKAVLRWEHAFGIKITTDNRSAFLL